MATVICIRWKDTICRYNNVNNNKWWK